MKFSRCGEFLALGNSYTGKVFVIAKSLKQQRLDIVGHLGIEGYMADFLIYERNDDCFEILVLVTLNLSMTLVGGDKIIVYTCGISNNFCAYATCVINLSRSLKMLYYKSNKSLSTLDVSSLSKQTEIKNNLQNVIFMKTLFSVHWMRKIEIYVTDSCIITYEYDDLIVVRDGRELGRVFAIFTPHHQSVGRIKIPSLLTFLRNNRCS